MKSWILSHKVLAIVLACILGAGVTCAIVLPIALTPKHDFSAEWSTDETCHWHACTAKKHTDTTEKLPHEFNDGVVTTEPTEETEGVRTFTCKTCGYSYTKKIEVLPHTHKYDMNAWVNTEESGHYRPTTCGHADKTKDFAAHTFDEGVVTKPEGYGVVGEKTFTCTKCGYEKKVTIDALGAKDNEIKLADGKTLGKTYDRQMIAITKADFAIEGNREPALMFKVKGADDNTYTATAPTNVGEYTVKVSAEATAEWKAASKTFDFAIAKKELTGAATKEYDGNATMPATLTGVVAGETVTATITMTSENVGATVKEVMLDGADKDNYTIKADSVTASITAKPLTGAATKEYDGNATMPATLTGVLDGETVTATITMTSKNVGATVKEVTLAGADKDNYTIKADGVTASITAKPLTGAATKEYDGNATMPATLTGVLDGEAVTATITMTSANVGAAVQSFELTGKDAGNYSLARADITATIIKADINFEISNASAFTEFFVGATNIPDPTTGYVEIGDGYGAKTIVWEKQLEGGVWSRTLTKEEVRNEKTGTYRVRIQYDDGVNYNFGATEYVSFTVKAKPRMLTVKSFTDKTYDGKPVANFTFKNLVNKFSAPTHDGVENFTSGLDSGEKYVEFRRKGEVLWTKVTDKYIPKNAAEYEYRIGVTATDEWAAVVSEIKTFKISQVEIKLEKGYVTTSAILQNGDLLYLATYTPVAGETITLRLVNGKAGLELSDTNPNYVKLDQKKQVSVQSNLDCFRLTSTSNANLSNYKIVKSAGQTKVEITVAPSEKGISKQITGKSESIDAANNKKLSMWTTVSAGSFQVGQTVIVSDSTGTKLFEAKIVRVGVVDPNGDGTYNITSQSGCVIPSDGKVRIEIDVTGITYDVNKVVGGSIRVK